MRNWNAYFPKPSMQPATQGNPVDWSSLACGRKQDCSDCARSANARKLADLLWLNRERLAAGQTVQCGNLKFNVGPGKNLSRTAAGERVNWVESTGHKNIGQKIWCGMGPVAVGCVVRFADSVVRTREDLRNDRLQRNVGASWILSILG